MGVITDNVKQLIADTATDPEQLADLESTIMLCLQAKAAHETSASAARKTLAAAQPEAFEAARVAEVSRRLDVVINPPKVEQVIEDPIKLGGGDADQVADAKRVADLKASGEGAALEGL